MLHRTPETSAEYDLMVFATSWGHQKSHPFSPPTPPNLKVIMERTGHLGFQRSEALYQSVSLSLSDLYYSCCKVVLPSCSYLNVQLLILELAAWSPALYKVMYSSRLWHTWIQWDEQPAGAVSLHLLQRKQRQLIWFRLYQTLSWLWWEKNPTLAHWG